MPIGSSRGQWRCAIWKTWAEAGVRSSSVVMRDPGRRFELVAYKSAWGGSAMVTVRDFRNTGVLFPRRIHSGQAKGDVIWGRLEHSHVLRMLHNPRYAGVFVYGRTRTRKGVDGECRVQHLPREEWHTFLPESHPAYISWQEYERNLQRLRESAQAMGFERRKSPPRARRCCRA